MPALDAAGKAALVAEFKDCTVRELIHKVVEREVDRLLVETQKNTAAFEKEALAPVRSKIGQPLERGALPIPEPVCIVWPRAAAGRGRARRASWACN